MSTSSSPQPQGTVTKSKFWLISFAILAVIVVIAAILTFTNERAKAYCVYAFKDDHFSKGDKMYSTLPPEKYRKAPMSLALYRLIRPITEHDIDSIESDSEKKDSLKLKINPLLEPYLIETHDRTTIAPPSYFTGNYLGSGVQRIKYYDSPQITYTVVDAIVPGSLSIDNSDPTVPPEGYIWANNTYYCPAHGMKNAPGKTE